ncbi:endonuclease [Bordetella phage vB_BbrP_BB8]|uniref:Endonuclease n=1 Tax=Bordetella phage vB_BbrP_BB8 TaxID=2587820 RepID=A0A4Y5TNR3_9CAUD|nr:endonuclease [Bordetella phage vB_BbrP_BB8]
MKYGFRSGLEEKIAADLTAKGVQFTYEELKVPFTKPPKPCKYTPDFALPNGIIVESKGRFITDDRQKQLMVKQQHPDLDIRFVFSNSKTRISKRSTTTYADWCRKSGFQYADKTIPEEWLKEPPNEKSLAAIKKLRGE